MAVKFKNIKRTVFEKLKLLNGAENQLALKTIYLFCLAVKIFECDVFRMSKASFHHQFSLLFSYMKISQGKFFDWDYFSNDHKRALKFECTF